jgi:RHS repeat-associated protein
MLKTAQKLFTFLSVIFFSLSNTQAQTMLQEYGETVVGADVFYPSLQRRGDMDVQLSTGKIVYVYTEKEANPSTGRDIWCAIYHSDMTVLVAPFRVNTITTGDQIYPTVKVHQNDNSFFVVWSGNQLSSGNDIYTKKITFDLTDTTSSSVLLLSDVMVNDITAGEQIAPHIAIDYFHNEVVFAIRDQGGNDGGGTGSYGVYLKRMSNTLTSLANQFLIHSFVTGNQVPNAIEIKGAYLIISFASNHVSANATDVYVIVYELTGPPGATVYNKRTEMRVNNYLTGDQNISNVAINETNGEFAVTWSSTHDGSGFGVYAKVFKIFPTIVVKDEFIVNSVTLNNQLLSKVRWEESTQQLIFFFHYSVSNLSTLKYRIFDGASIPGQYNPVDTEKDLIGGQDTKTYYNEVYNVIYNPYTHRLHLVYDIYDNYTGSTSKLRARSYIFKHPDLVTPSFINNTDLNRNWIHARTYAEDGSLLGETRQYYDSLSNPTQAQSRNLVKGTILAAANIFDVYNRAVIQTLPAPISEKSFTFKNNFITPTGGSSTYQYDDFDKPSTTGNISGEINNPKAVNINSLLGHYYSDSNNYESFVAATGFPYSRTNYNDQVYGGVVSSSSQGEALKMGAGHERKVAQLPVLNELDHYLQLKKQHFGSPSVSMNTLAFKAIKTVETDQNGVETISFTDLENRKIATAKANGAATPISADLSYNISNHTIYASPYLTASNLKISSSSDLLEVRSLQDNSLIFSGYATDFNIFPFSLNQACQVRSRMPFQLSYATRTNVGVVNQYNIESTDFTEGHSVLDIYLKDPTSLSLSLSAGTSLPFTGTLDIKVSSLNDGTVYYTGSYDAFSHTMLPAGSGFYRIELDQVPALEDYSPLNTHLRVSFNFPYSDWSYYFYDLQGNPTAVVAPKGVNTQSTAFPQFTSVFTYSSTGALLSSSDPDQGLSNYVYRKDGKLRFVQNAKQISTNKFSYTNYDAFGRTVESGEYDPALTGTNAKVFVNHRTQDTTTANPNSVHTVLEDVSNGGGLQSSSRTQVNYVVYDLPALAPPRTQTYIRGKVSTTYKKNIDTDASLVCNTWYSYDERGRVVWTDQAMNGFGVKTMDYTYTRELLTNTVYQKNVTGERFEHKYSYDAMQRIKKVETAAGAALFQTEAQYSYYLHGPLKRKELGGNVQGLDYVYTLQGWLKAINHPELNSAKDPGHDGAVGSPFAKDVFGMSFDYYQNDYMRSNSNVANTNESSFSGFAPHYNGTIRALTWQTSGQSISGNPCQYAYTYDYKYQLLSAVFGSNTISTNNFTPEAGGKYGTTVTYDLNGNLLSLNNNKGAVTGDNYAYKFGLPATPEYTNPTTNKLQHLINNLNMNDSRTYQYDELGQLINETRSSGKQKRLVYNVYGEVVEVRDSVNVLKASFAYNERGQRIRKITYGTMNDSTWYVLDISGNVLSIYDNKSGTMGQKEIPIYGTGREGVVQKSGSTLVYTYELKDHLGSVRATVDRVKQGSGEAELLSWMDYLAFGEVNPERNYKGAFTNRHQYQGEYAQHDNETEWEAFELRMYDARIGRWLSVDPMNQYWSPYVAMGNNPVGGIDPSGGYAYDIAMNGHPDAFYNPIDGYSSREGSGGRTEFYDYELFVWIPSYDETEVFGDKNRNKWQIGESIGEWIQKDNNSSGVILTSKESYQGSSEAYVRDRGNSGSINTVDADNITRGFNPYNKSSGTFINTITNFVNFSVLAEEFLSKYGAKPTPVTPTVDTVIFCGDTLYRPSNNPQIINYNADSILNIINK